MNKSDQQLISECLQGHTESFGDLVLRHQDRLFNSLAAMIGSAEDARDVAQDAFIHAFEKLQTFRGNSAFYSWLFRIAMNSAVNHHRKQQRATVSIDASREQTGVEPLDSHPESRPEYGLELSERQTQIWSALAELSEEYRHVLVLKEIEGLKYEEIAVIVNCPIGTVRSRIFRARCELRTKLRPVLEHEQT